MNNLDNVSLYLHYIFNVYVQCLYHLLKRKERLILLILDLTNKISKQLVLHLFVVRCTAHGHILTIMAGHVTGFIGSSCEFSRQVAPHALM